MLENQSFWNTFMKRYEADVAYVNSVLIENWSILYTLPRIQRGSNIFRRGGNFFPGGGVQMLISIETHITYNFPGGFRPPIPPLDPHMVLVHVHPGNLVLYIQGKRLCSYLVLYLFNSGSGYLISIGTSQGNRRFLVPDWTQEAGPGTRKVSFFFFFFLFKNKLSKLGSSLLLV